jgi:hypothetical protein
MYNRICYFSKMYLKKIVLYAGLHPIINQLFFKFRRLSCKASVAQLVEQLICNQWVGGSIPSAGSI